MPKGKAGIIRWKNDKPSIVTKVKAWKDGKNANETYTGLATTDAKKEAQKHILRGVANPSKGDYIELQEAHGPRDKHQVKDIRDKEKQKVVERKPVNNKRGGGGGRNPSHYNGGGS